MSDINEQIIQLYKKNFSLTEIGKQLNVTVDKVRYVVKKAGIYKKKKPAKVNFTDQQIQEIIDLYKNDISIDQIAKQFDCSTQPIVRVLTKHKVRKPNWAKSLPYKIYLELNDKEKFQQKVEELVSVKNLCEYYNVGHDMIRSLFKRYNIKHEKSPVIRSKLLQKAKQQVEISKENFVRLHFEENLPIYQIAEQFGISVNYLRKLIKKWNINQIENTRLSKEFKEFTKLDKDKIQQIVNNVTILELSNQLNVNKETLTKFLKSKSINIPCRYQSTGEKELVEFIRNIGITNVVTNTKSIIYPYELDIYLPDYNLAIEYCGLYWHSTANPTIKDHKNYHLNKLKLCEEKSIRLLTIFEDEWMNKKEILKHKIRVLLHKTENFVKANARDCIIREITYKEKKNFLDQHHLQGNDVSSVYLGLFNNDELVAVMTFSKPSYARMSRKVINKNNIWELNRYAGKIDCLIRGGFSKMLKYFIERYQPEEIYTYADKRYSIGDLYIKNGFTKISESKPNYWYVDKNFNKRYYRYDFAKYKLIKQGFDESKTEKQIMEENQFYRIYDCGQMKFVKKITNLDTYRNWS